MVDINVKVGRVYLKPLLPPDPLRGFDPEAVLKRLRKDILRRIRKNLVQEVFSDAAKKALSKAIQVKVDPSSLLITAHHPAFRPLTEGQRRMQMMWLVKAARPIPIITDTGKLIFRTATAKSMANGSWVHPGRPKADFLDRAKDEAREHIREVTAKEIRKQVKLAMGKRR